MKQIYRGTFFSKKDCFGKKIFLTSLVFFTILFQTVFISFANAQTPTLNRNSDSIEKYIETEYGELLYSEASVATRIELLSLLSKETPSILVFLHAVSMGLGVDDMLQAAAQYQPDKSRDFAESAISILPLLSEQRDFDSTEYDLEDLEKTGILKSYSVQNIVNRFFDNREVLRTNPDWLDGQYHFEAPVVELKQLNIVQGSTDWYYENNIITSDSESVDRPILISLYEAGQSILIDDVTRIQRAPNNSTLPILFIFNHQRERSIDEMVEVLKYPRTIRGVQQAYGDHSLMVTPVPEWQIGDHHLQAEVTEIQQLFEIPEQQDFEPEHWQRLLNEARDYQTEKPSFLITILRGNDSEKVAANINSNTQYAAYSDPRNESAFPYVNDGDLSLGALLNKGLIINRPDLIAAIAALGQLNTVPVAFYYIDNARTKPYTLGPRALRTFATGIRPPTGLSGGNGGFGPIPICASPPCS